MRARIVEPGSGGCAGLGRESLALANTPLQIKNNGSEVEKKTLKLACNTLTRLAKELLGVDEVPSKGSIMWEGEGSPDLSKFPLLMPGVRTRITHDRHLGVFIGDSCPASVRAVKDALIDKFTEKAHLISRLSILSDPQVKFNLLRC